LLDICIEALVNTSQINRSLGLYLSQFINSLTMLFVFRLLSHETMFCVVDILSPSSAKVSD